ncbi:hypothetical protein [Nocardia sp. 852002-20019_SCH5090214]|uniref:hypothetical protein n=2 Tax=Actinomycetes TaxID=1760 RepID=UPI000A6E0559|nr:hypothetical protein [Nocardia sp. 852002-20019_SCH5090214]
MPQTKFVRYARAVSSDYTHLFPTTPATRPLVVGIDLRTLGATATDYPELLTILRRDVVTPKLILRRDDDPQLAKPWLRACEIDEIHTLSWTDQQSAARMADALEFTVSTTCGGQKTGWRKCHLFDIYPVLDANAAATADLSSTERIDAAVLAAAGYGLGADVIVSLASTVGRADVADNDIVTTVTPDDLQAVFGHYLRMTGNRKIAEIRSGNVVSTMQPPSMTELYNIGVAALVPFLDTLRLTALMLGKMEAVAEIESLFTRLRRAARALDEVLAALSRTNGRDAIPSADTLEFVSEAFDRELLYLIAVFDTYGRIYLRWLDPSSTRQLRKSLHSEKTLIDYVDPNYPDPSTAGQLQRIHELQRFAFTCSELRNRIHDTLLPTGAFQNRTYGGAQAVAIDFTSAGIELTQQQVDRLGVWEATAANQVFMPPTVVADVATTAVELFTAAAEYVDVFSRLILTSIPAQAPNADDLLGKVTDTGTPIPSPHPVEQHYRRMFGWRVN